MSIPTTEPIKEEKSKEERPLPSYPNAVLYELRKQKGLSLRKAGKLTHTFFVWLYLFEQGYLSIPEKKAKVFASFYQVEPSLFVSELGYPTPIYKEKKDNALIDKASAVLFSWPSFWTNLFLLVLSLSLVVSGFLVVKDTNNYAKYYAPEYVQVYDYIVKNGTVQTDESSSLLGETTTEQTTYVSYIDENKNQLTLTCSVSSDGVDTTNYKIESSIDESAVAVKYSVSADYISFYYSEAASSGESSFSGSGTIENDSLLLPEVTNDLTGEAATTEETDKARSKAQSVTDTGFKLFDSFRQQQNLNSEKNLYQILDAQQEGIINKKATTLLGNRLMLIPSILGAVFILSFIFVCWGLFKKKKKEETKIELVTQEPEALLNQLNLKQGEEKPYASLKKNWKVFPFLPETFLRMTGIALVLVASIYFFNVISQLWADPSIEILFNLLSDALNWYSFLPYFLTATLMWFFVRIEIMSSEHYNLVPTILIFFLGGIIYYVAENMLSYYLNQTDNLYYNLLFIAFTKIMPGNLFWGIGCFAMIVQFLFTTPSFADNKKKVIVWRLLVLIPITYLVFSYFYSIGTSIWNWPTWPSQLETLLFRKQLPATSFAIFYPLSLLIYRFYLKKHFGEENAKIYRNGNHYFFMKNLIAASWVALLVLVNYLVKDTSFAKALDLNKSSLIAILIPFMLFYHPHMGDRNSILDNVITYIYILSMSFAYIYLGEILIFELPKMIGI